MLVHDSWSCMTLTNITPYFKPIREQCWLCNLKEAIFVYGPIREEVVKQRDETGSIHWKKRLKLSWVYKGVQKDNRGPGRCKRSGLKHCNFHHHQQLRKDSSENDELYISRILKYVPFVVIWTLCYQCFLGFT